MILFLDSKHDSTLYVERGCRSNLRMTQMDCKDSLGNIVCCATCYTDECNGPTDGCGRQATTTTANTPTTVSTVNPPDITIAHAIRNAPTAIFIIIATALVLEFSILWTQVLRCDILVFIHHNSKWKRLLETLKVLTFQLCQIQRIKIRSVHKRIIFISSSFASKSFKWFIPEQYHSSHFELQIQVYYVSIRTSISIQMIRVNNCNEQWSMSLNFHREPADLSFLREIA